MRDRGGTTSWHGSTAAAAPPLLPLLPPPPPLPPLPPKPPWGLRLLE